MAEHPIDDIFLAFLSNELSCYRYITSNLKDKYKHSPQLQQIDGYRYLNT